MIMVEFQYDPVRSASFTLVFKRELGVFLCTFGLM